MLPSIRRHKMSTQGNEWVGVFYHTVCYLLKLQLLNKTLLHKSICFVYKNKKFLLNRKSCFFQPLTNYFANIPFNLCISVKYVTLLSLTHWL